jgi:hypothetical protein
MEKELKSEFHVLESNAMVAVDTKESYEFVSESIIEAKRLKNKIVTYFEKMKTPAFQAWKAICAKENEMLKPVDIFIKTKNAQVQVYLTEQERIRREEQRRLDEARRKAEEAERAKLEKKAERAEAAGKIEKAEELKQAAEEVYIPPAIVETVEKTTRMDAGTVTAVKDVEVSIRDEKAVLKHILDGTLPMSVVSISIPKLKQAIKLHQIKLLNGVDIREVSKAQYRGAR